MSGLSFRNVWVEYGNQIVLEGINLEIASGTFLSVVGPSGAGKSTFLRLVLGQERPSQGTVMLDGKPFPAEPGPDRGIVFQRYSVFPHLTVLGNVLIGYEFAQSPVLGRLLGAARRTAIEKSREMIEAVGRGGPGCLNRFSASISGVSAEFRLPRGAAAG
jgi:NitT/TauT family transport system ATP-binding protein